MVNIIPFDKNYIPMIKDMMLDICLGEYKCDQWSNSLYMSDWRNWILTQNFAYYDFYPKHMPLVLDENNRLIGFISFKKVDNNTVEIKKIYISREYRSQNIGQQIFDRIIDEIKQLNTVNTVQTVICIPFIEAINFFEKNGFKITYFDTLKLEYKMTRQI